MGSISQPLSYAYNSQVKASRGTTPFNLTIIRPLICPIFDNSSIIALTLDNYVAPSSHTMSARILKRLSVMFDETYINTARADAKYKRYADSSIIHPPVFKPGDFVVIQHRPTEAKIAPEKEDYIVHSKQHYKTTCPYEVL